MNNDFLDPINAENMPQLADASLALSFLLFVKNGVRNTAFALAETASPDVREILRQQLTHGLALHTDVSHLMMQKGWFHPYQLEQQHLLDVRSADTVLKIANLDLFPDDTSRAGTFATPNI